MTRWLVLIGLVAAQEAPRGVDAAKIDAAVEKAVQFLKTARSESFGEAGIYPNSDELLLWAMYSAGVPETDPAFRKLFKAVLAAPLERTYKAAVQAIFLEEFDRVEYQWRIWQCAQFIVDNQFHDGRFGIGGPTPALKGAPAVVPAENGEAPVPAARKPKPKVVKRTMVRQTRTIDEHYYSVTLSHYVALALRACQDAGVHVPQKVLVKAAEWLRQAQRTEGDDRGGWCYAQKAEERLWQCKGKTPGHAPYLSTTLGALGALVTYNHLTGLDSKKDPAVKAGMDWLSKNFSMTENVGITKHDRNHYTGPTEHVTHLLCPVERLGTLTGVQSLVSHPWYAEGAELLLKTQLPAGSWPECRRGSETWNTCWAILFLRRATRPLEPMKVK